MQYADRALMEGLKGRCAMLLHPHVTQDSALPLLQQALAMDSDRSKPLLIPLLPACCCVHKQALELTLTAAVLMSEQALLTALLQKALSGSLYKVLLVHHISCSVPYHHAASMALALSAHPLKAISV